MNDVASTSTQNAFSMSPQELEFFLATIEASVCIHKHSQFYLWTQGVLQSFIPHETLICSLGLPGTPHARSEICTSTLFDEAFALQLHTGEHSLLGRLAQRWLDNDCRPILIHAANPHSAALLAGSGVNSALCHGCLMPDATQSASNLPASFFAFLAVADRPRQRLEYLLELLLPFLHMALVQLNCGKAAGNSSHSPRSNLDALSRREAEVLHWIRAGKTNQEIGLILDISALTVKNHVQKILRKLNVSNRAQAAAHANEHASATPSMNRFTGN